MFQVLHKSNATNLFQKPLIHQKNILEKSDLHIQKTHFTL